jgi:hypothetical protein
MPLVAVIVLTWNNKQLTAECLDALRKSNYPRYSTVLVNNGSTDDSQDFLSKRYPWATIHELKQNAGYPGGTNAGIKFVLSREKPDYFFFLSNDVIVDPECIAALVAQGEKAADIGALSPKAYFFDAPRTIACAGGELSFFRGSLMIGRGSPDTPQLNIPRQISFVNGCAFMMRRSTLEKIGFMDESLYGYSEDTDWSFKVRAQGFRAFYVPAAKVWHHEGVDFKRNTGTAFIFYLATKNTLIVFQRHYPRLQFLLFFLCYSLCFVLMKSIAEVLKGKSEKALGRLSGLLDFISIPADKQAEATQRRRSLLK